MKFILRPHEIAPESLVGGKARSLWLLTQADLPVPSWFVLLPDAFYESLPSEASTRFEEAATTDDIHAAVERAVPRGSVLDELTMALAELCPGGELVAVRSSASEEDSAAHSFAGQFESYLFVEPREISDRITQVWRSGFSERVMAYRRQAGLGTLPKAPAVLVQRMVRPDVSGVAFSADPVSGRRTIAVVAATWGVGSALVSGATDADTWRVDRQNQIIEEVIAAKPLAYRQDTTSVEGVRAEPVSPECVSKPSLSHEEVLAVAALAQRAERFFCRPQDIEWAVEAGQLYLLQSRPITALATKADPDGFLFIWDNSNIAESYSGITTPLTFSFARRAYEEVYRQFCRLTGISDRVIEAHTPMFQCMLGFIRGRVYYNLLNWYRLVALLPGFQVNRTFMEQMMGVREGLPREVVTTIEGASTGERVGDAFRVLRTLCGFVISLLTLPRRIRRFYARLNDSLGEGRPDLSRSRPDELAGYYRKLEQQILPHWDAPIVNDFATMIFYGLLRKLTVAWVGDAGGTLQNDLFCGEAGMISAEPARLVRSMAQHAATRPEFVRMLCEDSLPAIQKAMHQVPRFREEYQAYLDRFGDRCTEELKLESPTLHDDPLPLLRSVGQFGVKLQRGDVAQGDRELHVRERAEARVTEALRWNPFKQAVFRLVLHNARGRVRDRENLRFERTRVFGRARVIAVEMGKRLAALDALHEPRDIFYLEIEEILSFVEGRATTTDLKGLVAVRKKELSEYQNEDPPADRFETRGVVYAGNIFKARSKVASSGGEGLKGLGCCPGVVRGPVRLVTDPRKTVLMPGEIIVAERTDPGWVMIYPLAAGLLVERGSLLSHSAITAREIGLPTVVGLPGVTRWIQDGDWVEMDGSTGTVVRVSPVTGTRSCTDDAGI